MRKAFKSLIVSVLLLIATIMFLSSCAGLGESLTPAETFLKARMTFNGLLSDYVDQKKAVDPATRARWTKDIDPWFEKAAAALKSWQAVLKADGDPAGEMQVYLGIKNQLMNLVLLELTGD